MKWSKIGLNEIERVMVLQNTDSQCRNEYKSLLDVAGKVNRQVSIAVKAAMQ